MAYIKTLKDNELIGGTDNTDVYPVSTTQALFSQYEDPTSPSGYSVRTYEDDPTKPQRLEDRLIDHENDAKELHRKTERLALHLTNNQDGKDLEFSDSTTPTLTITCQAGLETFGDEEEEILSLDPTKKKHLESYSIKISDGTTLHNPDTITEGEDTVVATFTPQAPATYTVIYTATNDDGKKSVTKETSSTTYVVLRKYYGFSANVPTAVGDLNGNNVSHSVGGTVTIPSKSGGDTFKHVYFAIPLNLLPEGKTITVRQPDALNAPFAIHELNNSRITRTVRGEGYVYRLFESGTDSSSEDGYVDSRVSKRLTITVS